jgi:aspartokinase/homoserine dehydrogenase 1
MKKAVLKFGGGQTKDSDSIRNVAQTVNNFIEEYHPEQTIVVVSGAGKIGKEFGENKFTDLGENIFYNKKPKESKEAIISRTNEISKKLGVDFPKELFSGLENLVSENDEDYSRIVSFGERLSVYFISNEMKKIFPNSLSFDFDSFGMETSDYRNASATEKALTEINKTFLGKKGVFVVPGFLGYHKDSGKVTTLGRDGSNYSATKIAEAVDADVVYIFSDEPGVMRASPKLVSDAEILKELTYGEAIEFAELGAKIIYSRAVYPAQNQNIPIYITDENFEGTRISSLVNLENQGAKIIASSPNHSIITISYGEDKPGVLEEIAKYFREAKINIESISDERHSVSLAFQENGGDFGKLLKEIGKNYYYNLENSFARISIIGEGMKHQSGLLGKVAHSFGRKGISIETISQSRNQRNMTFFIDGEYERMAVNSIYDDLFRNR